MARVIVIGGGYGGITVARGLDPIADVILVEKTEQFVHHAAALRGVVDKVWGQTMFMPYEYLLKRGQVVRGTVAKVEGTTVHIYGQDPIEADYVVFATGSTYPFPIKNFSTHTAVAQSRLDDLRETLKGADRAVLIGGGTVGMELAGELKASDPDIAIEVVEKEDDILPSPGVVDGFRDLIREQAEELGITLTTGAPLAYLPPTSPGQLGRFEVETTDGEPVVGDVWFQCHGAHPITGYLLDTDYATALNDEGYVRVLPTMQVAGHERAYAIGDITDLTETKRADAARSQARVVVANIAAQMEGHDPTDVYHSREDWLVLPLGPDLGASQLVDEAGTTRIVGPEETAEIKGRDLMVSVVRSQLGLP